MFFVFGISSKEKEIKFSQTIICPACEAYGGLNIFSRYTYFSLFFIPILKWNKKYYLESSCCGSIYTISSQIGKGIEKGTINRIDESDLQIINKQYGRQKYCSSCNFSMEDGFQYCPKCGRKI